MHLYLLLGHLVLLSKGLTKSTFVERDGNILLWYINIRIQQVSSIHSSKVNRTSFIIGRLPA